MNLNQSERQSWALRTLTVTTQSSVLVEGAVEEFRFLLGHNARDDKSSQNSRMSEYGMLNMSVLTEVIRVCPDPI